MIRPLALLLAVLLLAAPAWAQEPIPEIAPLDPAAVFEDLSTQASMLFQQGQLPPQAILEVNSLRDDMNQDLAAMDADLKASQKQIGVCTGPEQQAHIMALADMARARERIAFAYVEELRILLDEYLAEPDDTAAAAAAAPPSAARASKESSPTVRVAPEDISTGTRE